MWSGAEPRQRALHGDPDAGRAAVETALRAPGVGDETELRGEHDLVPAVLDGPADELLVVVRAVDLGGVEEGDTEVEGPVDGADGLRLIGDGAVAPGHSHGAEADARDLEIP
jgi:hypothetical protein